MYRKKFNIATTAFLLSITLIIMQMFCFPVSKVNAASLNILSGSNRYATAVEVSKVSYSAASTVIIATGINFPDALSAGPLAVQENAPILLTETNSMPQETLDEITRLKATKAIIMGGEGVVGPAAIKALSDRGISVERVSGSNRFATAVEAAREVRAKSGVSDKVVLANGYGFADALSMGSCASREGIPILLTDSNVLPTETKAALTEFGIKEVQIIGGYTVVGKSAEDELTEMGIAVTRTYGSSRFATSVEIAKKFYPVSKNAIVANGRGFADALSAVPLAAKMNAPIMLVEQNSLPAEVSAYMAASCIDSITVVGGDNAVGAEVKKALINLMDRSNMKVSFIDVGQADSILIQTPHGKNVLIDAGNNEDAGKVISYLQSQGITRLDIVAGTHPHEDHIGGLDAVINTFNIGEIYMPKVTTTTQTFLDVIAAISNKGMSITTPVPGTTIDLEPGLKLEILAPNASTYDDLNNYSIVFKLTYGSKSFLFTGDAGSISEEEMLSAGFDLKADVLKVGHHGSTSSTTNAFLSAVSPKYAVISVGKDNPYGLPAQSTMDKLMNSGVAVYRTDECGTIVATCDGSSITFNTNPGSYYGNVETNKDIQITNLDLINEIVTIHNSSNQDSSMKGWRLVSVEGNQSYEFPENYILKAGSTATIASGSASGDLKWTTAYIWNNSGDTAELYDSNGALVSRK